MKQEQTLADHWLRNIFSLEGPIEFAEVLGSNRQIVLTLTKCASFREERRGHLGSSSRVSKGTGMESGLLQQGLGRKHVLAKPLEA